MRDRYADRIVKIEKTLLAIYERLPAFMQAAIADAKLTGDSKTVRESLKEMYEDTTRHDETGQI